MLSRVSLLLLSLTACGDLFAPASPLPPAGAVEVQRTTHYERVWASVEQCSGRKRDIREIRWYVVVGRLTYGADGRSGEYLPHYGIVLAEYTSDEIIAHEVLHALRRDTGGQETGHKSDDFLVKCKKVVA